MTGKERQRRPVRTRSVVGGGIGPGEGGRFRREVPLPCTNGCAGTIDTNGDTAPLPIALGGGRFVRQRVLIGDLVADLAVDAGQLLHVGRKERATARLLCQ